MCSIRLATLSLLALAAAACDHAAQQPIAFPKRAYLGETISTAIDTDFGLIAAKEFTLSSENVRIQLMDQVTEATYVVTPRAVILGSSAPGTSSAEYDGLVEVSVAVFDLPSTLPAGFTAPPSDVWIIPLHHPSGEPIDPYLFPTLRILGPAAQGEGATTFVPLTSPPDWTLPIEKKLEPLPSLRIQAVNTKFPAAWAIGGIQFDVVYPASVSNPRAYARNTTARGLAHANDVATRRARVMLVDPIELELKLSAPKGPFVDIVFDQSAPFATVDFDIENLIVTDVNGNVLVDDAGNSEEYFLLYARANQ
jgi:hypothetical protein